MRTPGGVGKKKSRGRPRWRPYPHRPRRRGGAAGRGTVAARSEEQWRGRRPGGGVWATWPVGLPGGLRPMGGRGGQLGQSAQLRGAFSFSFFKLLPFLLTTCCYSYFRPFRHFAKILFHHQYYQKNSFHMMNILVLMFEHFEFHAELEFENNWN